MTTGEFIEFFNVIDCFETCQLSLSIYQRRWQIRRRKQVERRYSMCKVCWETCKNLIPHQSYLHLLWLFYVFKSISSKSCNFELIIISHKYNKSFGCNQFSMKIISIYRWNSNNDISTNGGKYNDVSYLDRNFYAQMQKTVVRKQ